MSRLDVKAVKTASRICDFLIKLSQEQSNRWNSVRPECMPYGDLAYGKALMDWYQNGCPKSAWFSYDPSEKPCPYLVEFRKELSAEFGLRILTHEEHLEEEKKHQRILHTKVTDWAFETQTTNSKELTA